MIDLDATIEPAKAAAGLSIGDPVVRLTQASRATRTQLLGGFKLLDFGAVCVWVTGGAIHQIGVRGGYRGHVAGTTIGIGSTIQEVVDALGPVTEDDEDNLIAARVIGLCFETEPWRGDPGLETVDQNLDAKITELFVYAEGAS